MIDEQPKPPSVRPSFLPATLTAVIVSAFGAALAALMLREVPAPNRDIVVYMIGQLSGGFSISLSFWFGSTRQSEVKTQLLAQAEPVKPVE